MLTLTIIFLLILAAATHAAGRREDPLITADRLIAEQKYDDAILYLSDFMRKHPERFDEGQARIRKIKNIRDNYNYTASQLIDTIVGNPTDEERKLAMIRHLESLEKNPNPRISEFLASTKDLSLFSYNRAQFELIMAEGALLLAQYKFNEASHLYASGFAIYRDEFAESDYNNPIKDESFKLVDEFQARLDGYNLTGMTLEEAFLELAKAWDNYSASGQENAVLAAWEEAEKAALAYVMLRHQSSRDGKTLENYFEIFAEETNSYTENSFLPFAYRLVLGRKNNTYPEGITGSLDSRFTYALASAQNSLEKNMEAILENAENTFLAGNFDASIKEMSKFSGLAQFGQSLANLWSYYIPDEMGAESSILGQALLATKGSLWLNMQNSVEVAALWNEFLATRLEAEQTRLLARLPEAGTIGQAEFIQVRSQLGLSRNTRMGVERIRLDADSLNMEVNRQKRAGYYGELTEKSYLMLDAAIHDYLDSIQDEERSILALMADTELLGISNKLEVAKKSMSEGEILLEGIEASYDGALEGAISYYPGMALVKFSEAKTSIMEANEEGNIFASYYGSQPEFAIEQLAKWLSESRALEREAGSLSERLRALESTASENKRLADTASQEAVLRMADARKALGEARFDLARERLDRAAERYALSLSYEENTELRERSYNEMADLASAIRKAQNDLVVSQTRSLINSGKTNYFAGDFNEAENTLLRARTTWASTNTEAEPELEFWLRLVQTALTVKTGRDIPVTAPLYPEMSQLLSLARTYYEEAVSLSERRAGRTDILAALREAKNKIELVKLAFPLNQEAGILELKILKLEDPTQFSREFASRMESARVSINTNISMSEAYAMLKDLEGVDPTYRGLKAIIDDAEIKLGFRLPPPDRASLDESARLTREARTIYDRRDSSRYEIAKGYLVRAIELNPNNEEAASLKDIISIATGGDAELVLIPAAEPLFSMASDAYARRDYSTSFRNYVELVTKYPQAVKVQKVIELSRRLEAQGYSL